MRRRSAAKLRALIVTLAGAVALIGAVPAVAAAATPPVVMWASSSSADLGIVQIGSRAEAGIDGLTAHIRSYATGEEVAVITSFSLSSGTVQNGVFSSDTRVQLDRFGSYRIDVDAVDTLGQRTAQQSAGSLSYFIQPIFSALSFDHTTITYSRRTVKVKGTLSGKWPTDGLLRPMSQMPVRVGSTNSAPFVNVQTSQAGRFTGELTLDREEEIYARFAADGDYISGDSQFQRISVQPSPTRLTVKVSPAQVKLGETVTITGQLTWKSPDGWQPLANRRFGLLECDGPDQCPVFIDDLPKTDADGRFSVTSTPFATGFYQAGFSGQDETGQPDPFLAQVLNTAPVSVLQPAQFIDFTATRDESGLVLASGHLTFSNYTPVDMPVQIQYRAPGAASSWATVATIENPNWDGTGYAFTTTIDQPAAGHWRAFYPGQPQQFQTAVSPRVQLPATT